MNALTSFDIRFLLPFGIAMMSRSDDIESICPATLKKLIQYYKIVVLRGFKAPDKDAFIAFGERLGSLLAWEFGVLMEMRSHADPKNYLFTPGHVPYHWDGAFHQEPRFLLFHCVEAPAAASGGETLFANTNSIWCSADAHERAAWQHYQLTYKTEKIVHYGGRVTIPLVQKHPDTAETILRFAEPVPQHMLNPVEVELNQPRTISAEFISDMSQRCYQPQHCYTHYWEDNDLLFADNFALIHARRAYKKFTPRLLRRIQVL